MPASRTRIAMEPRVAASTAATAEFGRRVTRLLRVRRCGAFSRIRATTHRVLRDAPGRHAIAVVACLLSAAIPSGAAWAFGEGVAKNNCASCHTSTPATPLSLSVDQAFVRAGKESLVIATISGGERGTRCGFYVRPLLDSASIKPGNGSRRAGVGVVQRAPRNCKSIRFRVKPAADSTRVRLFMAGVKVNGAVNGVAEDDFAQQFRFGIKVIRDDDEDGIDADDDNCPQIANPDQEDRDEDGIGDACDLDNDNDSITDVNDNCPFFPNSDQSDIDEDGIGDACDDDIDNDGKANASDNCPFTANSDQLDTDGDAIGNVCDPDMDNDGIGNESDNCPIDVNYDQLDTDADAFGNACDVDDDNDGIYDSGDNCPIDINTEQKDLDRDGVGDVCDYDVDGDGINNLADNCPYISNPDQFDNDGDGHGDACSTNIYFAVRKYTAAAKATRTIVVADPVRVRSTVTAVAKYTVRKTARANTQADADRFALVRARRSATLSARRLARRIAHRKAGIQARRRAARIYVRRN